ncbi:hypothetical protein EUGRSUZ_L03211 [Eucalyptus grandis]|uniref:MATH domain-containing protein n=1 Tax=Eucalyptus grandis TaxID=71139 RepID=A0AAD9T8I8_EUCGR|nr:hypothetical protein EUGRSUZ_L03211 [Eucalyptus grandis]
MARVDEQKSVKDKRALPPAHFSLKIESFEALSTLDKYDSGEFKAADHGWRLSLYPKGNKNDNGSGYISLYLSIVDYADEAITSFHGSNTQHGFPRFLSLKEFKKRSNGYLDKKSSCTFGAEVLVIRPAEKEESLTLIRHPTQNTFALKIENWSKVGMDPRSIDFNCEKWNWKLIVYPRVNGKSLSVYLEVVGAAEKQVYADFKLRVLDQLKRKKPKEKQYAGT